MSRTFTELLQTAFTEPGFTGSQGFVGSQGADGIGATGFAGSQGFGGSQGFTGSQGPPGAGVTGFAGSQGFAGSSGLGLAAGGVQFDVLEKNSGTNFDATWTGSVSLTNIVYADTLTGGTGNINIGAGQLFKDNAGAVGIGTDSPEAKLHVVGDLHLSDDDCDILNLNNNSLSLGTDLTERVHITAGGDVGISTAAPVCSLDINTTDAVRVPVGTVNQRPSEPEIGMLRTVTDREDQEDNVLEFYDGENWVAVVPPPPLPISAGGGTVTEAEIDDVLYQVHTFTASSNFVVTSLGDSNGTVEYLIVGGGGAGGGAASGSNVGHSGGGSGGLVSSAEGGPSRAVEPGTYSVVVGGGGAGLLDDGEAGENSSFMELVALGGAGGRRTTSNGLDGGSGSGANRSGSGGSGLQPGSASGGLGNDGGDADCTTFNQVTGGGGGGTDSAGGNGVCNSAGDGGDGREINFAGTATRYGAGGGGGTRGSGAGSGGLGGGGDGSAGAGVDGGDASGFGSGGGGAGNTRNDDARGGNGSSGVVIIRYPI